ncbi:MAG: HAD family hydrolase [Candidatus Ranarchaeia archaeon]
MSLLEYLKTKGFEISSTRPVPEGPIKLIFFDFIATLVVFPSFDEEIAIENICLMLKENGYAIAPAMFKQVLKNQLHDIIQHQTPLQELDNLMWMKYTFKELGIDFSSNNSILSNAVDTYFKTFVQQAELIPGVYPVIKTLCETYGIELGIISNFSYPYAIDMILSKLGLMKYFSKIIVSGQLGIRKPHPQVFHKAYERWLPEIAKHEVLFIGDDLERDIFGGNYFGFQTAFATYALDNRFSAKQKTIKDAMSRWGKSVKPTYILSNPDDLLSPSLARRYETG